MKNFIKQLWIISFLSIAFIVIVMALGGKDHQFIIDSAKLVAVTLIASNIAIDLILLIIYTFNKKWKD